MKYSLIVSLTLASWLFHFHGSYVHKVNAFNIPRFFTQKHSSYSSISLLALSGADIEQEADEKQAPQVVGDKIIYRGKVNEIDYCIAPGDVSLSRASGKVSDGDSIKSPQTISLTQFLNNASNRAVRRILLAKSWPSEEAFNMSLRLAAAAEKKAQKARKANGTESTVKCPIPRPILNVFTRRDTSSRSSTAMSTKTSQTSKNGINGMSSSSSSRKKTRTNKEYVEDQIFAFKERYGNLPDYSVAEAYLESVLSLATTGDESPRVREVLESNVYGQSYRRVISVLKSVGVVLEKIPNTNRYQIAKQLQEQNICLSMMDTLTIKQNDNRTIRTNGQTSADEKAKVTSASSGASKQTDRKSRGRNRLQFWKREKNEDKIEEKTTSSQKDTNSANNLDVILCSEEPSMTRQLNAFSNIVRRVLLFGDDQEILVLSETLANNDASFLDRWYPDTGPLPEKIEDEVRPGIQYLNALICLLREAYDEGTVVDLDPLTSLSQSYSNSYERLVASLVEDGSGYIRPEENSDVLTMPKPRTATEELGRFAQWESAFRSKDEETSCPDDLEGTWEVKDEVGGETIGVSSVTFMPNGEVSIAPPLQGLRWRLDPGPTHLDTCTFQALSEDGTVLQYRGFIDRGARLEARFSRRPIKIRGSVMFQMRYLGGSADYWKEMLPLSYMPGATKFEMKKLS
mmetsp:Transcript_14583/g.33925  ORF Transcript_14583/g.33925 Transcript_14583/m.33925 type:complete len:685 (+) Transcript_14583:86-2140(+)|eukprot:CAMPEP_0197185116 /NCGR_PEP_ID=MMETSP1423-20130617/11183_1 /TAXON_ID=476441 /ORGANISM="Pseudo-nitzschia heimii, Strain UNC1101" /LENGTH=684 /DNA_ID=CAMNT_0042636087 /DNA_START=10 /DNA_END=2064 /DNA_ORIENTATION=+